MSTATSITTTETQARPELPLHQGSLGSRIAGGLATPGGAVFVLVGVLLVSIMISNPNFTDPGALIRFAGRTAPIAIAAMGQYYVIVSGEFDLSMGAVIAAQVVLAGNFIGQDEGRIIPGLLLMLAVGALIGDHQRAGHHAAQGPELHRDPRHDALPLGTGPLHHRRRRQRQPGRRVPRHRSRRHRGRARSSTSSPTRSSSWSSSRCCRSG